MFNKSKIAVIALICTAMILFLQESVPVAEIATEDGISFSFVVWGHPRGRTTGDPQLHFDEIIERIAELNVDLLVITGDVIHGMWGQDTDPMIIHEEWDKFDAGVSRLGIPVYRLPGNHDVHNNITRDIYLERYERVPLAFTFRGSRFIMLDTAGLKQVGKDDQATWAGLSQPFDDEQFGFIKDDIRLQDRYDHIFIFMHNPQPWSEPSTFWWDNIHPLLKGGATRAVFAGSPWYFKYAHMEQDAIHYILSSCLSVPSKELLRRIPNPEEWSIHRQLDNIQHVIVHGDKFKIRTIVVGAMSSKQLNWKFWNDMEKGHSQWSKRFMIRFYKRFHRVRDLVVLATFLGTICFAAGALFTAFWIRRQSK